MPNEDKDSLKAKKFLLLTAVILLLLLVLSLIFKSSPKKENRGANNNLIDSNFNLEFRGLSSDDLFLGEAKAPVQLIIYEDVSDQYSLKLDSALKEVLNYFPQEVALVYRPYVDKSFPLALPSRLFLECSNDQGKFFEARDLILSKVEKESLSDLDFLTYAQEISLDANSLKTCLQKNKYLDRIESLIKEAESFGVYGSPVIFVNQEIIVGAHDFEDSLRADGSLNEGLKSIIERHLDSIN